ncbi:MAG: DcaP family trimeric outer membrane transporter [Flavisolibacter sp.]
MGISRNFFVFFFSILISVSSHAQTKNSLELYGFLITDAGYNFNTIDPLWYDVMRPTKLPSHQGQFAPEGNVFYSVRQTKFGVKSNVFIGRRELKTQFDFDFVGFGKDAGQTTFHVVNAYAQLGKFGVGQTPSVFMDTEVFPQTLDYWGPASRVFFLNVQIRYIPIQKTIERLIVALERPGATSDGGDYAGRIDLPAVKPQFIVPNLTAHYRNGGTWGYVQAGGIAKSIKWKDTSGSILYNLSGSAFAWGFNLSTILKLTKDIKLKVQGEYGTGIENYIADAGVDIGRESNPGNPSQPIKGQTLPIFGLFSFAEIDWNKSLKSSIGYSFVSIENSDMQSAEAFHKGRYALVNLRYQPVDNAMIGIEYQYGEKETFKNGFHSNSSKLQLSFEFFFSKVFKTE